MSVPTNTFYTDGVQILTTTDGVGTITSSTQLGSSSYTTGALTTTWDTTHNTIFNARSLKTNINPQILAVEKAVLLLNDNTTPTASIGIEADNSGGVGTYFGMNLFNNNDTDFGITSTFPYSGSVVFDEEGGTNTTQTAIKQGTITLSDTALQPFTQITDTQIKIDDNFATTTPRTATLTSGNLEIKVVNVISSNVSTTDINPASITLENTGDPTTTFTTTSLTSGSSTATWADIISGTASDNTLQEVLTAGNTATNLNITLTNGGSGSGLSSMTLSPNSANIGAIENFTPTTPYPTAQTLVQVGASSGLLESSMFINDPSTPVQYQTIGKLYQAGDKLNDPLNVRPQLECFELFTDSMGTTTKEAKYNSTGITATNTAGVPYTITTDQTFAITSPNITLGASSLTFPSTSATEYSQLQSQGLSCVDTASSWSSWYRKAGAFISNTAGTIYTYITNTTIQITSNATSQNFIASSANLQITNGLSATYANLVGLGQALIATISEGYSANAMLELMNKSTTAGTTNGVPTIHSYKFGRNAVAGDTIGSHHFFAKNYLGTKTEFATMETNVRNTGAGNDDGSIGFFGLLNGVKTEFFRINGSDSENNMYLSLDMNGQAIKTTSGNLTISNTSASAGSIFTIATRDNVAGSGAGLVLSGNTLLSATSSGNSGQHLALTIGGTVYKIALLNN